MSEEYNNNENHQEWSPSNENRQMSESQIFSENPSNCDSPQLYEQQPKENQQLYVSPSAYSSQQSNTSSDAYYAGHQEYVRQQVQKEKEKFEKKKAKEARKLEKKLNRKMKKEQQGRQGHGAAFRAVKLVAGAAVFGLVALGTMYVTGDALGMFHKNNSDGGVKQRVVTTVNTNRAGSTAALKTSLTDSGDDRIIVADVSEVVDDVMPSIVAITSTQMVQSVYSNWFGFYGFDDDDRYEEQKGAGSGIIIGQNETELLVVTNNHVVEGADSLQVQFIDNETVDANVKGTNYDNDLAVVSIKLSDIKDSTLNTIKIATLGDSDSMKVGEGTIAIGNALGYGQSVTTGVVSALNREFTYEDRTMTLIQTDAAINPGNSGGALLNSKGEVIGINAAKYSSSSVEGMGFAIPVSAVKDVIEDLMNRETLVKVDEDKKGYINIYGRDVTEELSEAYNAPVGVLVVDVIKDGAADKAGIEKSDIITAINGEKVTSMKDLQERLEYYENGKTVTVTVQYLKDKEYVEKEVEVKLGGQME